MASGELVLRSGCTGVPREAGLPRGETGRMEPSLSFELSFCGVSCFVITVRCLGVWLVIWSVELDMLRCGSGSGLAQSLDIEC